MGGNLQAEILVCAYIDALAVACVELFNSVGVDGVGYWRRVSPSLYGLVGSSLKGFRSRLVAVYGSRSLTDNEINAELAKMAVEDSLRVFEMATTGVDS